MIEIALFWIAFNPIQVLCGFVHLGSLNDCVFFLIAMLTLIDDDWARSPFWNALLTTIAAYLDPRLLLLQIPITVIQARYQVVKVSEMMSPDGKEPNV